MGSLKDGGANVACFDYTDGSLRSGVPEETMSEECVKVLLLGEIQEDWCHLALHLEDQGCDCWLAKSTEDALSLLDRQKFQLVLTAKPLLLANAIVERLEELNCSVFYRYPVGDGCWWLPAMDHGKECFGATALRPREFVSALNQIVREIETTAAA